MNTRTSRMKTIVGLASREEDTAAKALADSQRFLEQVMTQRAEMHQCRAEYASQLLNKGSVRNVAEMKSTRVFIQQLDKALQQLDDQLKHAEKRNQQCLQSWLKLRNKTQALSEIKGRYQADEVRELESREQFETDELSQRK